MCKQPCLGYDKLNVLRVIARLREDHEGRSACAEHPISGCSRQYILSELLPYDPEVKVGSRLNHGLKEYRLLVRAAQEAVDKAEKGEMACFDPLVGENACQIRALQTCLIFSQDLSYLSGTSARLAQVLRQLDQALSSVEPLVGKGVSLAVLLTDWHFEVELTYSEFFLVQAYLLSVVKTVKNPKAEMPFVKNEYTDIKSIKAISPVGTMFAERLVKKLRELMSFISVSFVERLGRQLSLPDGFLDSLVDSVSITPNNLHCLPCFWATTVLMLTAQKKGLPLVVIARQMAPDQDYAIVNEISLVFEASSSGYRHSPNISLAPETPAIFLLVNSCQNAADHSDVTAWRDELLSHSPVEYVLAYAAAHRQYPNSSDEHVVEGLEGGHFEYYKEQAEEWGCSLTNPSGFFLSHAFCDRLENVDAHLEGASNAKSLRFLDIVRHGPQESSRKSVDTRFSQSPQRKVI